jgi:hypothetical protein
MAEHQNSTTITERVASDLSKLNSLSSDDLGIFVDLVLSFLIKPDSLDFQAELNSFAEKVSR